MAGREKRGLENPEMTSKMVSTPTTGSISSDIHALITTAMWLQGGGWSLVFVIETILLATEKTSIKAALFSESLLWLG